MLLGLDLSLTSPGIVTFDGTHYRAHCYSPRKLVERHVDNFHFYPVPDISKLPLLDRYNHILTLITTAVGDNVGTAIIEGYAYGANSAGSSKLYELGGIVKHHLHQLGWTIVVVAPTRVKKQFTGNGRADKAIMYATFLERGFPDLKKLIHSKAKGIPNPVQDVVDAVALVLVASQNGVTGP